MNAENITEEGVDIDKARRRIVHAFLSHIDTVVADVTTLLAARGIAVRKHRKVSEKELARVRSDVWDLSTIAQANDFGLSSLFSDGFTVAQDSMSEPTDAWVAAETICSIRRRAAARGYGFVEYIQLAFKNADRATTPASA